MQEFHTSSLNEMNASVFRIFRLLGMDLPDDALAEWNSLSESKKFAFLNLAQTTQEPLEIHSISDLASLLTSCARAIRRRPPGLRTPERSSFFSLCVNTALNAAYLAEDSYQACRAECEIAVGLSITEGRESGVRWLATYASESMDAFNETPLTPLILAEFSSDPEFKKIIGGINS